MKYVCFKCVRINKMQLLSVSGIKCFYVSLFSLFPFYSVSAHGCCIITEMAGRKKSITHIKLMAEIGKFKIEKITIIFYLQSVEINISIDFSIE